MSIVNAPSRGNSLGVWKMATIVPSDPKEVLEFTLNNGAPGDKLKEDRPGSSPLYVAPFPGSFKLAKGMLRPFPRGAEARIMLVSARMMPSRWRGLVLRGIYVTTAKFLWSGQPRGIARRWLDIYIVFSFGLLQCTFRGSALVMWGVGCLSHRP